MIWPSWDEIWRRVDWNEVSDEVLMFRLKHLQFEEQEGDKMKSSEVERMAESLELARNHHRPKTTRLMLIAATRLREVKGSLAEEEAMERMANDELKIEERIETK